MIQDFTNILNDIKNVKFDSGRFYRVRFICFEVCKHLKLLSLLFNMNFIKNLKHRFILTINNRLTLVS